MPIKTEVIEKAIEEMRDSLIRLLNRVDELEGLEDFADSIDEVYSDGDGISIVTENWHYTIMIDALNIE
ncbi:MAG: hypothetical protein KAS40_03795 [Desulfobacterales bacterium]|jgi:hypothetical protein|nr:hypothetical protein [Desulfobacterales bacterium]